MWQSRGWMRVEELDFEEDDGIVWVGAIWGEMDNVDLHCNTANIKGIVRKWKRTLNNAFRIARTAPDGELANSIFNSKQFRLLNLCNVAGLTLTSNIWNLIWLIGVSESLPMVKALPTHIEWIASNHARLVHIVARIAAQLHMPMKLYRAL